MTERKFTAPTEFPTEKIDGHGNVWTIVAQMPNEHFLGHDNKSNYAEFGPDGQFYSRSQSGDHLHDIPRKAVHWCNEYPLSKKALGAWHPSRSKADSLAAEGRIGVTRREQIEGQMPQYFPEEL